MSVVTSRGKINPPQPGLMKTYTRLSEKPCCQHDKASDLDIAAMFRVAPSAMHQTVFKGLCKACSNKGKHLLVANKSREAKKEPDLQMAAFGNDLARHALTDKWLMTAGKQLIRTQVLQTAAPPGKQIRVRDEDQKEAVPGLSKRPRKSMAQKGTQQVQTCTPPFPLPGPI